MDGVDCQFNRYKYNGWNVVISLKLFMVPTITTQSFCVTFRPSSNFLVTRQSYKERHGRLSIKPLDCQLVEAESRRLKLRSELIRCHLFDLSCPAFVLFEMAPFNCSLALSAFSLITTLSEGSKLGSKWSSRRWSHDWPFWGCFIIVSTILGNIIYLILVLSCNKTASINIGYVWNCVFGDGWSSITDVTHRALGW